ncbi:putative tranport protein (MFS family) [Halobacteriovorax marinus SJ]|uniref:Tranport protein (MFS family) n=1 Tax=Halobacteriovorax marinus (strain ATCC BAA-682 / DSM 15412 / SJ) TaxID=862908 RepID=E1X030_HALMS|nr:MFS transporter [Halobacteriovorax marinus]CBW27966.1 putative tranport protein (MFS family) [Halobacteriovorax marinus SJ]
MVDEVSIKNKNSWGGIWALAFGVSSIMIGEFLPTGLLTPIAKDLNITEGVAGQTVTVTSIFAVLSSLFCAYLTRSLNRRNVLIGFSLLTFISSVIVGSSSSFSTILVGRVMLGVALGGFWSMSTAIAIRIVEEKNVAKALSIIFGSASFSAMLAAPLGSFLGEIIGWRNVFYLNSVIGILGVGWIIYSMPHLKPLGEIRLGTIIKVFNKGSVRSGMIAIGLTFCGRFATLTFLRPYLEQKINLEGHDISIMFLVFDLAYFIGSLQAAKLVNRSLGGTMIISPILLALTSFCLTLTSSTIAITGILIFLLGFCFAPIPVSWSKWGPKIAPENTETIGGLYVAAVQTSAAIGSFFGGIVFDRLGVDILFGMSGVLWILASLVVYYFVKTRFEKDIDCKKLNELTC